MHRRENFGAAQKECLKALLEIINRCDINILLPLHPNPNIRSVVEEVYKTHYDKEVVTCTKKFLKKTDNKSKIYLTEPLAYPELVFALKHCQFVMTDSGGIQEEAPSFKKNILVLRDTTERPEGVSAGFARLVGTNLNHIVYQATTLLQSNNLVNAQTNPYGDGNASSKIINDLLSSSN